MLKSVSTSGFSSLARRHSGSSPEPPSTTLLAPPRTSSSMLISTGSSREVAGTSGIPGTARGRGSRLRASRYPFFACPSATTGRPLRTGRGAVVTRRRGGRVITGASGKRNPTSVDGGNVNSTGTVAGTKAEGGGVDRRRGQEGVVGGYLERVTCFCGAAFERGRSNSCHNRTTPYA
jgi:hypothetical protein